MDLNLKGKQALVCGASKGLGFACAMSLAREGVNVTIVARHAAALADAASQLRIETGVDVVTVAADVATQEGRAAALEACSKPDILVTNCGGPKSADFRQLTQQDWLDAFHANMYAGIALIGAVIDSMIAQRFGRIVNITSATVKMPVINMELSNAARAGLTGYVGSVAREVVQHNVTINNLLPGPFETDRIVQLVRAVAERAGESFDTMMKARRDGIPAKRLGQPKEFGDACAFLCSDQAGFITGQNLVIDGGRYPGTL